MGIGRGIIAQIGLIEQADARIVGLLRLLAALGALPAVVARSLFEPDRNARVARSVHHTDDLLGGTASRGSEGRFEDIAEIIDEGVDLVIIEGGVVVVARENGPFG